MSTMGDLRIWLSLPPIFFLFYICLDRLSHAFKCIFFMQTLFQCTYSTYSIILGWLDSSLTNFSLVTVLCNINLYIYVQISRLFKSFFNGGPINSPASGVLVNEFYFFLFIRFLLLLLLLLLRVWVVWFTFTEHPFIQSCCNF